MKKCDWGWFFLVQTIELYNDSRVREFHTEWNSSQIWSDLYLCWSFSDKSSVVIEKVHVKYSHKQVDSNKNIYSILIFFSPKMTLEEKLKP